VLADVVVARLPMALAAVFLRSAPSGYARLASVVLAEGAWAFVLSRVSFWSVSADMADRFPCGVRLH